MKVKDLLKESSKAFHSIDARKSVEEAVKMMSGYSESALLIKSGEDISGIFTERDLLRCHIMFPNKDISRIPVHEVMTSTLIVADPGDTVEEATAMMIKAKIRHLPVISNGRVNAILCLEDLVRKLVKALTSELHYLKDYISDLQDAAHD